jgi:hypothetical protein
MSLFDTMADIDTSVYRNIASFRVSINPFDDLTDNARIQQAAIAVDMHVRRAPTGIIERGLAYSEAIGYPFAADRAMASRYGDGTVRVWYGAFDTETTIAETCYHAIRMLRAEEGVATPVVRHRKVYQVHAAGLFLDLRAKAARNKRLLDDDYAFTQAIGKRVAAQGLPGLLFPSARIAKGECLAAFRSDVLHSPKPLFDLTYTVDAVKGHVDVVRAPGSRPKRWRWEQLRR